MKNLGEKVSFLIICEQVIGNQIKKLVNQTEKSVNLLFQFGYSSGLVTVRKKH